MQVINKNIIKSNNYFNKKSNINFKAIINNVSLNNFLNNFSGIKFNIFLPKFVPINTAKINGNKILNSFI